MSLRARVILYLVIIHTILGLTALVCLWERRLWLIAAEVLFGISVAAGVLLVRAFFVPLDLIRTGTDLLNEQDLTATFNEVGQPEMDALVRVYNRMSRQLREDRLRLTEQHLLLTRVLDASPAGVLVLDLDGRVSMINPAARSLLERPEEQILGRRLMEIGSRVSEEAAATPAGHGRVFAHEGRRRLRCQRGSFLDHGFARSFIIIEELTEEVRQSERAAYEKLIRMMSHEVNNSAGAVVSLLESCRTYTRMLPDGDREDCASALEVASGRMRHLNGFMNGFADVVRLPPPDRRPCDLKRLIEDIVVLLRPELRRRRITVAWKRGLESVRLDLDKNQIEQALVNIMLNALEAVGEDGRIDLLLQRGPDGAVRLGVKDSGPGISREAVEHLFTPFFSSKRNGRGVGLTLISEILSHHHADFGLANHLEGGAEFWIVFRRPLG